MRKQTICSFSYVLSFWCAQLALCVLSTMVEVSRKRLDNKLSHEHLCTLG